MVDDWLQVQADFEQFIASIKTLLLATVSDLDEPEASYVPFVHVDGVWYVFVSELAKHTANLMVSNKAAVLLIADEQDSSNLFARKRVSFQMSVSEVSRETEQWSTIIDTFELRFGSIMNVIKTLSDFHLIALHPISGGFVRSFGQAFTLGGEFMLTVATQRKREARA
jgi:hypothetical protein